MKLGFGSMILGSFMTAGDNRVSEADRIALVEHVLAALPALLPFAEVETQLQIRNQVDRLVDGLPAGKLRDAVQRATPIIDQVLPRKR